MDWLKMLMQMQDCHRGLTVKEGIQKMSAEGEQAKCIRSRLFPRQGKALLVERLLHLAAVRWLTGRFFLYC
jgi:hypothetical protein